MRAALALEPEALTAPKTQSRTAPGISDRGYNARGDMNDDPLLNATMFASLIGIVAILTRRLWKLARRRSHRRRRRVGF